MRNLKEMFEESGIEYSEKIFRNEESIASLGAEPFVSVHKLLQHFVKVTCCLRLVSMVKQTIIKHVKFII